jgi:hypothetical protein
LVAEKLGCTVGYQLFPVCATADVEVVSIAQDAVLEAVFNFFVGVAFLLIHRNRKNEERFREARKQLTDALEDKK